MLHKLYKSAYLYQSGAIESGDCIYAESDADASMMAEVRAKVRRAQTFGLYEVTGHADDGTDLIRPVGEGLK